jgi:uncharacterized membrane protein
VGAITLVVGLIIYFGSDKFGWIGKLPGDFRIENENVKIYIPVTTMILMSILLTLLLRLIRHFF